MKIISTAFEQNTLIPGKYACHRESGSPVSACVGVDINPPLAISGTPEGAKSLVLIVDDPDAPSGTWVHWIVWNIPAGTQTISEKFVPTTGVVQGMTSAGSPGYGGPYPPSGTHHYFFKVYALDVRLDLPAATDSAGLEAAMEGHVLDKAGLIGLYQRSTK